VKNNQREGHAIASHLTHSPPTGALGQLLPGPQGCRGLPTNSTYHGPVAKFAGHERVPVELVSSKPRQQRSCGQRLGNPPPGQPGPGFSVLASVKGCSDSIRRKGILAYTKIIISKRKGYKLHNS